MQPLILLNFPSNIQASLMLIDVNSINVLKLEDTPRKYFPYKSDSCYEWRSQGKRMEKNKAKACCTAI